MTKEQFEIGDEYLKILNDNGGYSDRNEYYLKLGRDDVKVRDLNYVLGMLSLYNFIKYLDDKKFKMMLTSKGEEAFKVGLNVYFKNGKEEYAGIMQEKENK